MKKFIVTLFALVIMSVPAFAFEVKVPDFDVNISGKIFDYKATEYPLLVYKDITYFPMTYGYIHMLGLTSSWVDGAFYLSYCPPDYQWSDEPAPAGQPVDALDAQIAQYPIYINGKLLDNSKEEYPVLNARDITYFPMTWRFAVDEFGMRYDWNGTLYLDGTSGQSGHPLLHVEDGKIYFDSSITENRRTEEGYWGFSTVGSKNYVFDTASGTFSEIDSLPYYKPWLDDRVDEKMSIDGNMLMYEDIALEDISDYLDTERQREDTEGVQTFCTEYRLGCGKLLLHVEMDYASKYANPHAIGLRYSHFIIDADRSVTKLPEPETGLVYYIDSHEYAGGRQYIGLRTLRSIGGGSHMLQSYNVFVLNDDNSLTPITDADHGSIMLLGQINGRPVALATWKIEYEGVSAVNDGYFYIEPDGSLTKFYPYVYAEEMAVADNHLYLLIRRNNTLVDACCGKEYSF